MIDLQDSNYDPNAFIDWLIDDIYDANNDAALARAIGCSPVVISKIRHRRLAVPLGMLVVIHEFSGMRTLDIKARMFRQSVLAQAA